jgi:hypothetical protein
MSIRTGANPVTGVSVTFQYGENFEHARVVSIAERAARRSGAFPG